MNTEANFLRRSSLRITVVKAALVALCAIAPVAVMADPQAAVKPVTSTAQVSLADLDLATPQGLRAARERLHQTARRLCSQVADSQDLSHQSNFVACVDVTLANAMQKLSDPALAAVEKSQMARPTAP